MDNGYMVVVSSRMCPHVHTYVIKYYCFSFSFLLLLSQKKKVNVKWLFRKYSKCIDIFFISSNNICVLCFSGTHYTQRNREFKQIISIMI